MSMPTLQDLIEAGAHIGHKKSKWNPKMAPFVFGVRKNLHIIDVTKTLSALTQAIEFLKGTVAKGGVILWIGVNVPTKEIIKTTAQELGMPFITNRWVGGLFTNFKIIKERLKYFRDLEQKVASGELDKYTKKERLNFERQLQKLARELGGIKNLEKLPEVIFVSDINTEHYAISEAKKMNIKIVGLADTNADPNAIDYAIPVNNDSIASLNLVINAIKEELKKYTFHENSESSANITN